MAPRSEAQRLSTALFFGTLILIVWLAWQIVRPFVLEIGWAVVLAICLDPLRRRLEPRLGRTRTALLLVLGVLVLIVLPSLVVGSVVLHEGHLAAGHLKSKLAIEGGPAGAFHRFWEWARTRVPILPNEHDVIGSIADSTLTVAGYIGSRTGRILAGVASFLVSLAIVLGVLFFLVRDASAFAQAIQRILPFGREKNRRLVEIASDLVSASITSTLVIAGIQGILGGTLFALLGIPGAAIWGVMMAILALLPLVGAALVWVPAAVWLALTGHLVQGIVLAAVGVLVLGNVDNVVRPLLLSGKSEMNTLVLIISLMGGVSAFGFIGIVLGPLVAALLTAIVESHVAEVEPVPVKAPPADSRDGTPVPAPGRPALAPGAPAFEPE